MREVSADEGEAVSTTGADMGRRFQGRLAHRASAFSGEVISSTAVEK